MFESDSKLEIQLAPKLTYRHLILPPFSKMSVPLAVHVISHTVAGGLHTYCALGGLLDAAADTAEFLECFNNLFDCFNSSCLESEKPYRSAIWKDSKHKFLDTMTKLLSTVHIINQHDIDITSRVKCVRGWQQNITALKLLLMELSNLHWFQFILTRRLNQDPLDFF